MFSDKILNAKPAYTYDDFLLVPNASWIEAKDVETTVKLTKDIKLNIPIMSAAMDTVTEARLAIALAQEGGIGVIHRNITQEAQVEEVRKVKNAEEGTVITNDVTLDDLMNAFQKFLERKKKDAPLSTTVTKREITVEERRYSIRSILKRKGKVDFFELFEEVTKEYIVVTFLAILEMARKNELTIYQENDFDKITVEVKA